MVTLPSEAADDRSLVRSLFQKGMEIARINCAHDDEAGMGAHGRKHPQGGRGCPGSPAAS